MGACIGIGGGCTAEFVQRELQHDRCDQLSKVLPSSSSQPHQQSVTLANCSVDSLANLRADSLTDLSVVSLVKWMVSLSGL